MKHMPVRIAFGVTLLMAGYGLGHWHGVAVLGETPPDESLLIRRIIDQNRRTSTGSGPVDLQTSRAEKHVPRESQADGAGSTIIPAEESILTSAQVQTIRELAELARTPGLTGSEALMTAAAVFDDGSALFTEKYPHAEEVERKWREGQWEEVVKTAEERLSTNPRDIPGLLMYVQYYAEMIDVDNYLVTVKEAILAIKEVRTPLVSKIRPAFISDLYAQTESLQELTPERVAASKKIIAKRDNRPFFYGYYLKVCEADGLF